MDGIHIISAASLFSAIATPSLTYFVLRIFINKIKHVEKRHNELERLIPDQYVQKDTCNELRDTCQKK